MSASLVGSEMCIRDRGNPAQSNPAQSNPPQSSRSRGNPVRAPCARRSQPVSYTHLTLPTICSV
eukprot:1427022-Alexandrium_andersonii.AAC.1